MKNVTSLQLKFKGKLVRQRLFYSSQDMEKQKEAKKDFLEFPPNQTVAFVKEKYARKKFCPDTMYVIKTIQPEERGTLIEGVTPGAAVLLKVRGETRIRRTLLFFENIMKSGVDLVHLSDSVFSAIHTRNEANMSLDFLAERVIEDSKFR